MSWFASEKSFIQMKTTWFSSVLVLMKSMGKLLDMANSSALWQLPYLKDSPLEHSSDKLDLINISSLILFNSPPPRCHFWGSVGCSFAADFIKELCFKCSFPNESWSCCFLCKSHSVSRVIIASCALFLPLKVLHFAFKYVISVEKKLLKSDCYWDS